MSEYRAFKARIEGFVQGVGFRYSTVRQARRLGLTGYVMNLSGGDVEVQAEGEAQDVERLKEWLRHGPPGAVIRNAVFQERPYTGTFREFDIEF